jgi:hypothetical protein
MIEAARTTFVCADATLQRVSDNTLLLNNLANIGLVYA